MRPLVGLRVGESSPGLHKTVDTPCSQWLCTPCLSQRLCTSCSMSFAHPNGCARCANVQVVSVIGRMWVCVLCAPCCPLCPVCPVHLCVRVAHRHRWWVCVQCLVWCALCTIVGELRAGGGESGHCHRRHLAPIPSTPPFDHLLL